jgi:hypothetical protein
MAADGGIYARTAIKSWMEECFRGASASTTIPYPTSGERKHYGRTA